MPIVSSEYRPPFLFRNGHVATIYPNIRRYVQGVHQKRERINLSDGDFIDLDWSYCHTHSSKKLVIIIHGLEGNGQRQYILGTAKHLNKNGWDAVAINLRSCSGENNRLYKSYHAGASEDIEQCIHHIINRNSYPQIGLCGFSLGGNIVLKYLGEDRTIPKEIKAAIGVSVPCDLYNSLLEINKPQNYIYQQRFIRHLKTKLYERQTIFPDQISIADIKDCKSLMDIDNLYTSKAHGYINAMDYYTKCSSLQYLKNIRIPSLILNAKNDSFLGNSCYPIIEAQQNSKIFLEIPKYGGHVGFYTTGEAYYNEVKTLDFFMSQE
ncbi:YheT family hydrolase [Aquimarina pacifica]|uniref:YheT family hydrolase n=1 Tax=Aquimarina pacifica TaxID=1296415 RepID=UPI0004708BED|nr:alpha/beta fold hydrolase [Aquimarina pacifica]